jgi:hypothetical protein
VSEKELAREAVRNPPQTHPFEGKRPHLSILRACKHDQPLSNTVDKGKRPPTTHNKAVEGRKSLPFPAYKGFPSFPRVNIPFQRVFMGKKALFLYVKMDRCSEK